MGTSCSLDPGSEEVEECGKRLSEPLWASEDLSCSSRLRQDEEACGGSPEQAAPTDSQRAISLDASEPAAGVSNQALVRSTALEDLTCVDDRSSWVNPAEEAIAEQLEDTVASLFPAFSSEPQSDVLQAKLGWRKAPESKSLLAKVPSGAAAEKRSSDSPLHTVSHSKTDFCDESDRASSVVQTTGTAELQRTSPRSSPSGKSLVPIPVPKGLCAVLSPPQLIPSTNFSSKCSFCCGFCCTLPPRSAYGSNSQGKPVFLPPHLSFWFHCSIFASLLVMQPPTSQKQPTFLHHCFAFAPLLCRCACMCAGARWQRNAFSLKCTGRRTGR